jgi:CBS domain-containing protein
MRAEQLMTRNVYTCKSEDSLEHAAGLMWQRDVGCLVVVDDELRPMGMITDRDVAMAAFLQGVPLKDGRVASAMARDVRTCRGDEPLADVEALMRMAKIRRVPVVDGDGRLMGLLTLGDIARSSQSGTLEAIQIPGVAKTLAAVTEPRRFTDGA